MADVGRPPLFKDPEEIAAKINSYFEHIKGEKQQTVGDGDLMTETWLRQPEPATITGMALFLGFSSRQSIYDYEENGEFSYAIKSARLRVECEYEKRLSGNSPTGAIFALKNLGWKDKTETDMNLSGELALKQITGMEVK